MYRVVFSPESRTDLRELRIYIARNDSPGTAPRYMARLKTSCQTLELPPHRGELRPGIPFNQRTIGFERRVSVIFELREAEKSSTSPAFATEVAALISRVTKLRQQRTTSDRSRPIP